MNWQFEIEGGKVFDLILILFEDFVARCSYEIVLMDMFFFELSKLLSRCIKICSSAYVNDKFDF